METWREGARAGHTHEPNEVTIQLDGLGRQLSELLPEPGAPEGSDGPVFVDESGRRSKSLRRLGWVLAAICVGYAVTLVVALLGGNSSAPFLPLSGQEEHRKAEEVQTPVTPGTSSGAQVSPGALPSSSPSAPQTGESAAATGGEATGDGSSPATGAGAGSSASAPVVPSAGHTRAGQATGGGKPVGETTATTPAVDPGTPTADPVETPSDPATTPAGTPDPPVQEQEGAS
ncbi:MULTISPECIES: hypothetical protein [unclassified Streptomyces]|uniref:hypothetical protein n=1 Tax=unclassified Streptomyces TaxID=2593676 RepID=UPI002256E849|nr:MULTISPECIES: hypothetical protein [unclassified Streptomyces]MCX5140598.1 hypothetical protein [Streptomyces sp. NBC_00338]WRZ65133.1 hypothetical protein OG408_15105 [Streptomyces sp. NBC_01257]WSU59133.1 hypothetical protein OG450_15275 [Streptomyces sp. NBC_01104]